MKKALVLVAMILLVSLSMQAQSANPIYFGARGGVNLGNASITPDLTGKSGRTGLAAGAYGEFGVAEGIAVTVEALYVQGGFKGPIALTTDDTFKWDALTVPVNLKYMFPIQNSTVKPYVFGGGHAAFTMKSEVESSGVTVDIKDSTESVGFGVQFGAGVQFEVSPGVNLLIDGQYDLGLKNMSKITGVEIKPNGIQVMVGVAFKVN